MRQISRNLLIVLCLFALGTVIRSKVSLERMSLPNPGILGHFPYIIGPFSGRDFETGEAVAARAFYHPADVVFREYRDGNGHGIELFIAPTSFGWKDPAICLVYHGSIINYAKESYLALTPPVKVREIIALSPLEQSDETDACVYYWRGNGVGYENPLAVALRKKLDLLAGKDQNGLIVQACSELRKETEPGPAFGKLRDFVSKVDPIVVALLRSSGLLVE